MVADKDAQLSALTNELEISQKELCEDKLSGLTRELETLQQESTIKEICCMVNCQLLQMH